MVLHEIRVINRADREQYAPIASSEAVLALPVGNCGKNSPSIVNCCHFHGK
jgi:hypothetical protein